MSTRLIPALITSALRTETIGKTLICLDTIDSTNNEARRRAGEAEEGTVILCEQQTAGRGRLGRQWVSPRGKGICMTVLLSPKLPPEKIPLLTQVAAAAVTLALEETDLSSSGLEVQIKWPNDILIQGKKIGGILTEMQTRGNAVQQAAIGIGLNINLDQTEFPEELQDKASSLYALTGRQYAREAIIAGVLNQLEPLYHYFNQRGDLGPALTICRDKSAVIGKRVTLTAHGAKNLEQQDVTVYDLGEQGELLVRGANGEQAVISGEISLHKFYNS